MHNQLKKALRTSAFFFTALLSASLTGSPSKKSDDVVTLKKTNAASPSETPYFKELVNLVKEEKWFFVFHKLDGFEMSDAYSKKKHGSESAFRKNFEKALLAEPVLKPLHQEIVFRDFLNKLKGKYSDDPCDGLPDAPGPQTSDPYFDALKRMNPEIKKAVYIEGFGGKAKYDSFLSRKAHEGIVQLPLGLGGWTKFCREAGVFWLRPLAQQWVTLLTERQQALEAAFAKGKLTLEKAVELGNWYLLHVGDGGGPGGIDIKTARLTIKNGNYHLSDPSQNITDLIIDGKTHTVTKFEWFLED